MVAATGAAARLHRHSVWVDIMSVVRKRVCVESLCPVQKEQLREEESVDYRVLDVRLCSLSLENPSFSLGSRV